MKKRIVLIVVFVIMFLMLTGCTEYISDDSSDSTKTKEMLQVPALFSGVHRIIDEEFDIVCYVYGGGGISCVNYDR